MADLKISQLNSIVTVVPATDVLPVVQGGTTLKITPKQILESGSPAVLASATITGDLTVDTSTLKVDSTNDRVGINNATPGVALHLGTTSGTNKLAINTALTSGGDIQLRRGAFIGFSNAADAANSEYLFANGGALEFGINGSTAMTLNTSGNLAFATGKGIDFSAVTGGTGTVTANVLNDYEEGTFTPTLQFSGLSVGVTYSTRTGIYTKVGRIVHFSGRIDLSSKGTSVGDATISGLPFGANTGAASVGFQSSIAPSDKQAILTIDTTSLIIRYASGTTTAASTATDFSNSSILIFAGTYAV